MGWGGHDSIEELRHAKQKWPPFGGHFSSIGRKPYAAFVLILLSAIRLSF